MKKFVELYCPDLAWEYNTTTRFIPYLGQNADLKEVVTRDGVTYIEEDLPGFDKSEISVDVMGSTLLISAESKTRGKVSRRFDLERHRPGKVRFVNGVLSIELMSEPKTRLEIE